MIWALLQSQFLVACNDYEVLMQYMGSTLVVGFNDGAIH